MTPTGINTELPSGMRLLVGNEESALERTCRGTDIGRIDDGVRLLKDHRRPPSAVELATSAARPWIVVNR